MFVRTLGCILVSFWIAGLATAQARQGAEWDEDRRGRAPRYERDDRYDRRDHGFAFRTGLGFTADPSTFLTAFELPYYINSDWQIGPALQIGVDDRETLVAATFNTRYFANFGQRDSRDEFVRKLAPYFHGGLGLVHIDIDRKNAPDRDDTAFLFNLGFGLDFPINDQFSVGSQMSFNVIPGDALGENFFFSWQLATVEFRF
jgi:hypothetical protein